MFGPSIEGASIHTSPLIRIEVIVALGAALNVMQRQQRVHGNATFEQLRQAQEQTRKMRARGELRGPRRDLRALANMTKGHSEKTWAEAWTDLLGV